MIANNEKNFGTNSRARVKKFLRPPNYTKVPEDQNAQTSEDPRVK